MPQIGARLFVPAPIHLAAETVHQFQPGLLPLARGLAGMGINPVLKGIHRRDPGENPHDPLQMIAPRAPGVGGAVKCFDEFVAEQFHAHGGDFAELNAARCGRRYKSSSRAARAWKAWPASCRIVSTSRWMPTAFMKMKGRRDSDRVDW